MIKKINKNKIMSLKEITKDPLLNKLPIELLFKITFKFKQITNKVMVI